MLNPSAQSRVWGWMLVWIVMAGMAGADGLSGDITRVHDPVIIKHDDQYYMFSTGRGIPMRRSPDLVSWDYIGRVFDTPPGWVTDAVPDFNRRWRHIWAPDIAKIDGRYYLYYSISTFGKQRSAIGLAVNTTLDRVAGL